MRPDLILRLPLWAAGNRHRGRYLPKLPPMPKSSQRGRMPKP
jgi:hypothetical protein